VNNLWEQSITAVIIRPFSNKSRAHIIGQILKVTTTKFLKACKEFEKGSSYMDVNVKLIVKKFLALFICHLSKIIGYLSKKVEHTRLP